MMDTILITGGSGLIGQRLTQQLLNDNYDVIHLSRSAERSHKAVPCYVWDINNESIDEEAVQKADSIIHLAGANVNHKWTDAYKQEIEESRVRSTQLLYETIKDNDISIETFICSSAVGRYGDGGDQWLTEDTPPADDFLGRVCQKWERAAQQFTELNIRTVRIRTGVVLEKSEGALPAIAKPVRIWMGAPLGSGHQYMPWIHIDDICGIYQKALEDDSMEGPYNAAAPHPVTNREMTKAVGRALGKPVFMPPIPKFVLRLMMGEMSEIVLNSLRVSSEKLQQSSYQFRFPTVEEALADIYGE